MATKRRLLADKGRLSASIGGWLPILAEAMVDKSAARIEQFTRSRKGGLEISNHAVQLQFIDRFQNLPHMWTRLHPNGQ